MESIGNKSILVIDDDYALLRALTKVLSGEGAAVTCANWAGDAIEILTRREKPIDLVITDLRMPFVNGMTVVYAIHVIFPALPVIVLTAFGTPEVKAACHDEGAVAFLEKPLDSQELLGAVRRALRLDAPAQRVAPARADISSGRGMSREPRRRSNIPKQETARQKDAENPTAQQTKGEANETKHHDESTDD